jgi:hypothetical protein
MINPVIALLHNRKLNRWHPIVFDERPLPGPPSETKPVRHKSIGHHTEGFATREAAVDNITNTMVQEMKDRQWPEPKLVLREDIEWDGEDVPALVAFFVETPEGWTLAL